ncbi:HAD family hydrolase [Lujinxingia litoralis]|uniref:HAD family hydrolase n=1 Tax=Lujinxingia litoralis TaxID=2211119 RepID=A0A328C9L9_9DELT|nr:HAD-IG family 5'-nucleotidase [Lujinxingia litoralis]RAL23684.1 HAD family hydrolase [Lujinxingia litoralis]
MTFGIFEAYPEVSPQRGVFCNRTLNLRSIKAVGYDMDYTLVHYHVDAWEGRAYEHIKLRLLAEGWPVEDLHFDPNWVTRGLVIDLKLGNLVKANRFGYVWRAAHGTEIIPYAEMRDAYTRTLVDLNDHQRWVFLNTFFSISAGVMYAQLVDLLDRGVLPEVLGYVDLYGRVQDVLDAAHIEGELKAEIMAHPEVYVDRDPEVPLTLLDQRNAGKKLILITNSEWSYTHFMMAYTIDPYLPEGMTWRDIFDLVVVSARKPAFFSGSAPIFEVVNDEGLLKPWVGQLEEGRAYLGGSASDIEGALGFSGDEILYVGDHLFADVNVTKSVLRWRTALVMRELENELHAIEQCAENQVEIRKMMLEKVKYEDAFSIRRLALQRLRQGYGPQPEVSAETLETEMAELREKIVDLDTRLAPLVMDDGVAFNASWGYLMRTGNDKSHLTRQVERYADIYTSRVSNLLRYSPFMFFRAPRGSVPHDPGNP